MSQGHAAPLAPVSGKARIEVLDVLRGIAILGIFYVNVPYMAAPVWQFSADIRAAGWTPADQQAWAAVTVLLAGTQRCLLELLFGAGMMVIARKAMEPEGPVGVSDLYYRRTMWLLLFGLADVFLLLWPGDILHIYALAGMFIFAFRRLAAKWLLAIGLVWAAMTVVGVPEYGVRLYAERAALVQQVDAAKAREAAGQALAPAEARALAEWHKLEARRVPNAARRAHIEEERRAHAGGLIPYVREAWDYWGYLAQEWLVWDVIEAFCTMLIGVGLWKWGVIQGQKSRRFYALMMLGGYGFGLTARIVGAEEVMRFDLMPHSIWITGEVARLAVGIGHLAAVNWAMQTRGGAALLSVFKAPGRMAFSLYFLQQFVGIYLLFAPFGLNLWGRFGWAQMAAISTAGIVLLVLFANLWMRVFASGPLEWLWRSLSYLRLQPLLVNAPPPQGPALSPDPSAA